jgi:hypothetical protein
MRIRRAVWVVLAATAKSAFFIGFSQAQTPEKGKAAPAAKAGTATPKAVTKAPAGGKQVYANLGQLMRGILYPASNVIFAAQGRDPNEIAPAKDPSVATDPLQSAYGKWTAVENAALALSEGANLLSLPGRVCANGKAVPVRNADWGKFVTELKDAGWKAYNAAKAKNQDQILDAADAMTTACANCHDKYREKPTLAERCQ